MRKDYFLNAVRMLQSQLKEEEEHYEKALRSEKDFAELKQIKQRIKSLKELLLSLESKQEDYLKEMIENFTLKVC